MNQKSADTHLRVSLSEALEYLLQLPQFDTLGAEAYREGMVEADAALAQADALREAVALAEAIATIREHGRAALYPQMKGGWYVSLGPADRSFYGDTIPAAVQAALEAVHVGEPPLTPAESATPTEGQP